MSEMLVLRLLHIAGGVFWAGSLFMMVLFIEPLTRKAGPEGGRMMQRIAMSKYTVFAALSGIVTVLSGLRMYQVTIWRNGDPFGTRMGIALTIGGATALVALLIGMLFTRRAADKMAMLGRAVEAQGTPPTEVQMAEIGATRNKLVMSARTVATLLAISVVTMATARYLG